jgi:hypothetical protein
MPTLTSSQLAEKLNQQGVRRGVFFMPAVDNHVERVIISNEEVLIHEDYLPSILAQLRMGPAVTAFVDLKPVAIFGFIPVWSGVAEAWLVVDNHARKYPVAMTKYGIAVQDIAKISLGLHRTQITVRMTDKRAYKWALALGFRQEGVMSKYGPDGIDYILMARF